MLLDPDQWQWHSAAVGGSTASTLSWRPQPREFLRLQTPLIYDLAELNFLESQTKICCKEMAFISHNSFFTSFPQISCCSYQYSNKLCSGNNFCVLPENLQCKFVVVQNQALSKLSYLLIFSLYVTSLFCNLLYVMLNNFPSSAGIIWYVFWGTFPPPPLLLSEHLWSNAHRIYYFKCFSSKKKCHFPNWNKPLT